MSAGAKDLRHEQLVAVARRWLEKTVGCSVVLAELVASGSEVPDAIGWKISMGWSWLVECKVSRADFFADGKKPHRQAGNGYGQERYYLVPAGLIREEEVPNGWGLLEWTGRQVRVVVPHPKAAARLIDREVSARELPLALSALRRKHCSACFGKIDGRAERIRDTEKDRLRAEINRLKALLVQGPEAHPGRASVSKTEG